MGDIAQTQVQMDQLKAAYQALVEAEKQHEQKTVSAYAAQLELMQHSYQTLPPSIPRPDTIPVIFNRTYDENFLSDYLVYILDPARNGLGPEPLGILVGLTWPEFEEYEFEEVIVYREYPLDSGRIDLLIVVDDALVVGIENKIFSSEGANQTSSYAKVIRREFPGHDHALVYLSPGGTKPGSKHFRPLSYRQLLQGFRALDYDWTADIKKSVLWEDFSGHLEEYIVNEKSDFEFSARSKLFIENYEMLNKLQGAFADDWGKLLNFIQAKLDLHLNDGNWGTNFNKSRLIWHQIIKHSWQLPNLSIHYEFFFDQDRLAKGILDFMCDVERQDSWQYLSLFDQRYPDLSEEYARRGMVYRPAKRKIAIAWKTYQFDSPFIEWDKAFIKAYEEFSFLTPHIDDVIAEYLKTKEN